MTSDAATLHTHIQSQFRIYKGLVSPLICKNRLESAFQDELLLRKAVRNADAHAHEMIQHRARLIREAEHMARIQAIAKVTELNAAKEAKKLRSEKKLALFGPKYLAVIKSKFPNLDPQAALAEAQSLKQDLEKYIRARRNRYYVHKPRSPAIEVLQGSLKGYVLRSPWSKHSDKMRHAKQIQFGQRLIDQRKEGEVMLNWARDEDEWEIDVVIPHMLSRSGEITSEIEQYTQSTFLKTHQQVMQTAHERFQVLKERAAHDRQEVITKLQYQQWLIERNRPHVRKRFQFSDEELADAALDM